MVKKIIINARTLTLSSGGNKNFTSNFIAHLSKSLPNNFFEIIVPTQLTEDFDFGNNCHIKLIEKIPTQPSHLSISLWDNSQISEYLKTQQKEKVAFFLSTHHALPIKKLEVPEFIIIHDIHLWKEQESRWSTDTKFGYEVNEKSIYNADLIFTVSDFTKREIEGYFYLKDTPVIPIYEDIKGSYKKEHPVDLQLLKKKFGISKNGYFLYIGSLEPRKNIHNLLKAYKVYWQKSKFRNALVIVGSYTKRIKEFEHLDFGSSIKRFTEADTIEIYNLYKQAMAFVYPSLYEGFGLQILEAQNMGCPMVGSDIEVFREVAGNGMLFFNPHDIYDIAQKMIEIESNTKLREDLIKNGKDNVRRYTWEKTVGIFLDRIRNYL